MLQELAFVHLRGGSNTCIDRVHIPLSAQPLFEQAPFLEECLSRFSSLWRPLSHRCINSEALGSVLRRFEERKTLDRDYASSLYVIDVPSNIFL